VQGVIACHSPPRYLIVDDGLPFSAPSSFLHFSFCFRSLLPSWRALTSLKDVETSFGSLSIFTANPTPAKGLQIAGLPPGKWLKPLYRLHQSLLFSHLTNASPLWKQLL